MVRKMIAVVAGAGVAVLLVMLIQQLGHSLYPPPDGLDPADEEFMRDYIANLPWGPLAFAIASYVVSTLVGGWVAAAVAGEQPLIFAGIVALFVLAGAVSTMLMIPHPTWFMIAAVGGIVLAVVLAVSLASRGGGNSRAV